MHQPDTHFFLPQLSVGTAILDPDESLHAIKVCRAAPGDCLQLCDGQGHFAQGRVLEANPKACSIQISHIQNSDRNPPRLHLALACLKDDAIEEVVFHCSQLEIGSITLLRTEHSLEPRQSDLNRSLRRCRAKSLVSLKQCRKPWLTQIFGPIYFKDWLLHDAHGELIVCDPRGPVHAPHGWAQFESSTLLVGPEGGFSLEELVQLEQWKGGSHTHWLGLGPTRLRAVTAPLYALGILSAHG